MSPTHWQRQYRECRLLGYPVWISRAIADMYYPENDTVAESPTSNPPGLIERDGSLAVVEPNALAITGGGSAVWLSWRPSTDLERAVVLAAMTGEIPKLSSTVNTVVRVANVGRKAVQLVDDKTGEVREAVRTVLFTHDGAAYSSVSDGIDGCLRAICSLWGPPPWSPPLPLTMKSHELPGARRFYTLEFDTGANPLVTTAKRK